MYFSIVCIHDILGEVFAEELMLGYGKKYCCIRRLLLLKVPLEIDQLIFLDSWSTFLKIFGKQKVKIN